MNTTTGRPADVLRRIDQVADALGDAGRPDHATADCDWCGAADSATAGIPTPSDGVPAARACRLCADGARRFARLTTEGVEAAYGTGAELLTAYGPSGDSLTFRDAKAARGYLREVAKTVPGPRRRRSKAAVVRKSSRVLADDWRKLATTALGMLGYQVPSDADGAARVLDQLAADPIADVLEIGARAMAERSAAA